MMYICVGKGACSRSSRKSPEYNDILPISPSKIQRKVYEMANEEQRETESQCNGIEPVGLPDGSREIAPIKRRDKFLRMNSLNLDLNSNPKPIVENENKSSTLPRRSQPKQSEAPPKPPRVIPPKPPRMMEKRIFICENPLCRKEEELLGIVELTFKSCSACFTHYCSPECKKIHWPEHRTVCRYGTIDCHMKSILRICKHTAPIHLYLSETARNGFMAKGRGAVMLIFLSPKDAELFIKTGLEYFKHRRNAPSYSSLSEIQLAGAYTKYQKLLLKVVSEYSTVHEFVVNIAIVVGRDLHTTPVPRNKSAAVIEHLVVPLHSDLNAKTLSPQGSQDYGVCQTQKQDIDSYLEANLRRKSL